MSMRHRRCHVRPKRSVMTWACCMRCTPEHRPNAIRVSAAALVALDRIGMVVARPETMGTRSERFSLLYDMAVSESGP